jgi:hypothetical protein
VGSFGRPCATIERYRSFAKPQRNLLVKLIVDAVILAAIGFTVGFAATATAAFVRPALAEKPDAVQEPVRRLADEPPVRIVGPLLVLNFNPSER